MSGQYENVPFAVEMDGGRTLAYDADAWGEVPPPPPESSVAFTARQWDAVIRPLLADAETLRAERETLHEQIQTLKAEHERLRADRDIWKAESKRLRAALEEAERSHPHWIKALDLLNEENVRLRDEHERLRAENAGLRTAAETTWVGAFREVVEQLRTVADCASSGPAEKPNVKEGG